MQPSNSREMQGLNSLMNPSSLHEFQNGHHHHHNNHHHHHNQIPNSQLIHDGIHGGGGGGFEQPSSTTNDDFLEQIMLSSLPSSCSWPDLNPHQNPKSAWDLNPPNSTSVKINGRDSHDDSSDNSPFQFDESTLLAAKLRHHQISGGTSPSEAAKSAMAMMFQQQMMMSRGGIAGGMGRSPSTGSGCGDSGLLPLPLSLNGGDLVDQSQNELVDGSSFKSPNSGLDGSVQSLYNGFSGSLHGAGQTLNQSQQFHHPQGGSQNFGAPATVMNQTPGNGSAGGGAPAQPRQRVRARRGQATDPHSIAERLRRERIAERMKALQELVPNANKTDKASMLDEIIDYVKFLQLQVKVLSMSRLGGASAVAPLVADMSSEGGGDCVQTNGGIRRSSNGTQTPSTNDSMTVTEHQVAKLMEEDMGSAMQYLQGKGLCLMPISLATAISTATCHSRNPLSNNPLLASSNGEGPTSPSLSVLTVQSATMGGGGTTTNGAGDCSVKDANSVSKP